MPTPQNICILPHKETWVTGQIFDEAKAIFPVANVTVAAQTDSADLVVIPYMDDFYREVPGGLMLYKQLQRASHTWVMLYGVGYRKIDVMPAPKALSHYQRCARTYKWLWYLRRLHLTKMAIRLLRAVVVLS